MPYFLSVLAALGLVGTTPAERLAVEAPARVITVAASGDIASCDQTSDERTAEVVRRIDPDAVLTMGDNVYPSGTAEQFAECYGPSWGAFRARTFPGPGNHDYETPDAAGYFGYFGNRARGPYYSFNLDRWHLVSLNTEIDHSWDSPQLKWLRRDLRRDRRPCEILYWHKPRWSGGAHGSSADTQPLWRAAYENGVDLVLAGHDHNYQRFRRLNARGRPSPRFGVIQVVAGAGGRSHYDPGEIAHRVAADGTTYGVVKLNLLPRSFALRFVPVAGGTYTDTLRSARCHGVPRQG